VTDTGGDSRATTSPAGRLFTWLGGFQSRRALKEGIAMEPRSDPQKNGAEKFRNKALIFSALVVLSLMADACQSLRQATKVLRITNGVAVSLNALEKSGVKLLPPMIIRGITIDRVRNDWVIFGDFDPKQKRIPVDAVKVAVNAVRRYLDAPGVDIRPASARAKEQVVTYFGGVKSTEVGQWFFVFDYWMKKAALGETSIIPQVPVYFQRVVHNMEQQRGTAQTRTAQGNRFWLCAGEFTAKEEKDTLTFEETPLHVFAERLNRPGEKGKASPCATQGTEDTFATEFAKALTDNLDNIEHLVPIAQIRTFARLLAAITWTTQRDPYRDLTPWLTPIDAVETPSTVPTLSKHYKNVQRDDRYIREIRLEMSGGVTLAPKLMLQRGYEMLLRLHRAIIGARPAVPEPTWNFSFDGAAK
jgi:hypothetical protein